MTKKIYVGNIPFKATQEDLKTLFSKYGEVESVNLITDPQTGRSKGFGFVEMATDEDASKAISGLNKSVFMERELSVAEAKPQQPRERRGFERRKARGGFGRGQGRGRR
jgi:cold-inducible RNA-binding protein